jgi:hypothetical protein
MSERHKAFVDDPRILQAPVHRPIFIDPSVIRPLPQSLWGIYCDWCDKRQSKWELFLPEAPSNARKGVAICSVCWLYESEWGKKLSEDIALFIAAVEKEISRPFQRREDGALAECRDADRVLGAIAVTSRIFAYKSAMGRIRDGA